MSLYAQPLLGYHDKLIGDGFAGGGGASHGIEKGLGRPVDIAINHDPVAIALHEANHPQTRHHRCDIFEVDPRFATQGIPMGFMWFSPDCTYFSKARGQKPIRSPLAKRRSLAWVVFKWVGTVRPDCITLENVEEFIKWGPLVGRQDNLRPCKKRAGKTFKKFIRLFKEHGYTVEWRFLAAHHYGAATKRKRLYLIARCDGLPIVWPEVSHGDPDDPRVMAGELKRFKWTEECIDWSLPMCSIFATKEEAKAFGKTHKVRSPNRPLAEDSYVRIARGVKRFVLESKDPYLRTLNPDGTTSPFLASVAHGEEANGKKRRGPGVRPVKEPMGTIACSNGEALISAMVSPLTHQGERRSIDVRESFPTITTARRGEYALTASVMIQHKHGAKPFWGLREPTNTITAGGTHQALYSCLLVQNNAGYYQGAGHSVRSSLPTILTNSRGHHALVAAHICRDFGQSIGSSLREPIGTITATGNGKAGLVYSLITKYYGTAIGQDVREPLHTIGTIDTFGIVNVRVGNTPYYIRDIMMRMLQPRELFRCQGFPDTYIIDVGPGGRKLTKTEQVHLVGNSVCPDVACAIVRANVPHLIARPELQRVG